MTIQLGMDDGQTRRPPRPGEQRLPQSKTAASVDSVSFPLRHRGPPISPAANPQGVQVKIRDEKIVSRGCMKLAHEGYQNH